MGVTAVELMPVQDFLEGSVFGGDGGRRNYWGYDPLAFFAPHRHYAVSSRPGAQVAEFKELVRSLHAEGLEVILDIVLNHTCEQGASGTVLSWKGIDASAYYLMHGPSHQFSDYSGCGNAIHANDPVCREMLISVLRHWVHEYHVDGFRFDLASILNRTSDGQLMDQSPLIEAIQRDPLLSGTKWIAEAWDAAGAYQVGSFGGSGWSEWNGRFRDDVRRFWRGDPGMDGDAATRFSGSSDLYQNSGRLPSASINFVASHDGYTLADLVAYEEKHNDANGWDNRDGENQNFSWNHGVEGPTNDPEIAQLRCRQQRNFFVNLLLAKGVPMWTAGDEGGRTQSGNNNAYCQDNEVSWIDWGRMVQQDSLVEGVAKLVELRKSLKQLGTDRFFRGAPEGPSAWPDILWLDPDGRNRTWDTGALHLACWIAPDPSLSGHDAGHPPRHLLVWFHAGDQPQEFRLPEGSDEVQWHLVVDTTVPIEAPWVFHESESRVVPHGVQRILPAYSSAVLIGNPKKKR
jgi:glycogen operon protein